MLHHVSMLWIIEAHEQLQYHMETQISELMTGGPWYNTSLFVVNYIKLFLRGLLEMQELTDIISCVLFFHMKKSINNLLMMVLEVEVVHYQQIQQQKHYICSVQP